MAFYKLLPCSPNIPKEHVGKVCHQDKTCDFQIGDTPKKMEELTKGDIDKIKGDAKDWFEQSGYNTSLTCQDITGKVYLVRKPKEKKESSDDKMQEAKSVISKGSLVESMKLEKCPDFKLPHFDSIAQILLRETDINTAQFTAKAETKGDLPEDILLLKIWEKSSDFSIAVPEDEPLPGDAGPWMAVAKKKFLNGLRSMWKESLGTSVSDDQLLSRAVRILKDSERFKALRFCAVNSGSDTSLESAKLYVYRDISKDVICAAGHEQFTIRLDAPLTPDEAAILIDLKSLTDQKICKQSKPVGEGRYYYQLTVRSPETLQDIISELESKQPSDERISKLSPERRKEIAEAFKENPVIVAERRGNIAEEAQKAQEKNMDRMMAVQIGSTGVMGIMFYLQLRMAQKQMNLMMGKVEIKMDEIGFDMVQQERESISKTGQVTQAIVNLDEQALEYLRMLRRPKYGNPFIRGESGSGKDMIVRRAAQLLALRDPRIVNNPLLKPLLDKPLWYIDPTRAQKGAGVVGSGAKVMDAIAAALERGEMAYWPELAQGLRAFAHSKGESESPATLLKTILDKTKRGFSGSATDADFAEIAEWIGDVEQLERRMPVLRAISKSEGEIFAIVKSSKVPEWGKHYNVRVDDVGLIDRAFNKLAEIRTQTGSVLPLFDAAESLLMSIFEEANKAGADKISAEHVDKAIQKLTSNGNGDAGKTGGKNDAKMDSKVREQVAFEVKMARLMALVNEMIRMEEFAGEPQLTEMAERYLDRWLNMTKEERNAIIRSQPEAVNKTGIPKQTLVAWKAEDDKASQRSDDDDQSPPPVTAEGGADRESVSVDEEPAWIRDGDPDWHKNRTSISSAVGAGASSIGIGKGKTMVSWWPGIQTVAERAVNVVREPVATAVTPEGFMFSVQAGVDAELSSVQKARLEANVKAIQALTQRPFATNAGTNLLFGWGGWLMIHEVIEPELGRELSGKEKLGAYVGTGILGSLALSSLAGASMRLKDLLIATPTGMLTFLPVGMSVSSVANSAGIDPNTKEGELVVITAGGVLAAATSTATLPAFTAVSLGGATTIAEAGLTLAGTVFGIGAGVAVGAAMLSGGAAGLALDHGLGKVGLGSSDGDETLSGGIAELLFRVIHPVDPDDYTAKLGSIAGASYSF